MEQPLNVIVIDDSRTISRPAQSLLSDVGCEVI
ncbi:response regulator, partial [Pseudomonas fulva]